MKRILVAFILVAGVTMVAYAGLNTTNKKTRTEKKAGKCDKKDCPSTCPYSSCMHE